MKQEINDTAMPTGQVHIQHFGADGELKGERQVKNLVVTTGKNYIASKMVATTNSPVSMTHMAIGTGSTTPAAANTALGSQTGRVSLSGSSVSSNAITYTATFPAGTGDGAITEAGIFNASSGGTMLCRTTFPVVNKASGDTIAVTWVVTVS
jgi:hypothetical protein